MSKDINQDTGLTPQEEDLLLGEPDMDIEIEEDIDKILGGAKDSEDGESRFPSFGDINVTLPEGINPKDPLQLAGLVTSTPIKGSAEPNLKSSPSGDTSLEQSGDSGLGGLRVPEKTTRLAEPRAEIEPEPQKPRKRKKVVTFADAPGLEARPYHDGGVPSSPKKRRSRQERKSSLKKNSAFSGGPIRPEKTRFGSGDPPSPEVIELEDGELPSVQQNDPILEDVKKDKMGKGMSLPRVLRSVADVLEEGEIEDEGRNLALPRETNATSQGRKAADRGDYDASRDNESRRELMSGSAKGGPQAAGSSEGSGPPAKVWKKNNGRGVKGKSASSLPRDNGTFKAATIHGKFKFGGLPGVLGHPAAAPGTV